MKLRVRRVMVMGGHRERVGRRRWLLRPTDRRHVSVAGPRNVLFMERRRTMSDLDARLAHKRQFIPKQGYGLVGLDDFERPGEELYLVGHFGSREEAEAARCQRLSDDADEILYIYGPDDR